MVRWRLTQPGEEVEPARTAAKREIDALNAKRHELIEAIDAAIAAGIEQTPEAPPPTESPARVLDRLSELGVICDWREPDVIRIAPIPLYNRFAEVFTFSERLAQVLQEIT